MVVLDLETCLIEPGKAAPPVVCVSYADDREGGAGLKIHIVHAKTKGIVEILRRVLSSDLLVGVNIAYDLACILQQWPELSDDIWRAYDEDRVADCMYYAQLSDIRTLGKLQRSYSMAAMLRFYLGEQVEKGADTWRLRYGELLHTEDIGDWPPAARQYALDDIRHTFRLWRHLVTRYERPATLHHQTRAAFSLHLASAWGWRTNPQVVHNLRKGLEFSQKELREELQRCRFLRSNGTQNTLLIQSEAEGLGATERTPTGKIKVDAAVIKNLDDERFRTLSQWKKSQKLLTTYVPLLERGTRQPLHPYYRVCVESGRTSASNPNIQNLPRDGGVRDAFEARTGRVFVAADYSVAELVCLAQCLYTMYGDNALRRTLMGGEDLHLTTAAMMTDTDLADLVQRYKNGDPQAKYLRQFAKAFSFGIPGGLGRAALRDYLGNYGINLTEGEAAVAREKWLEAYPEVRLVFKDLSKRSRANKRFTITHPLTGFTRAGCTYTSGANFYFQHLGAYAGKRACYLTQRACWDSKNPLHGSRLVGFVHDELILSCPENKIDQSARELEKLMKKAFADSCPDVPVQVESLAMKRWYKDAKRVEVNGRLKVWAPSL